MFHDYTLAAPDQGAVAQMLLKGLALEVAMGYAPSS